MFKSKVWIFFVLASFSVLLVPKNAWHDCTRYHATEHHDDKQKSFGEDSHCFICDFQLSIATVHTFPVFRFPGKQHAVQNGIYGESQCIVPLKHLKLRGPPNESMS